MPVVLFGREFWDGLINFERLVERGLISREDADGIVIAGGEELDGGSGHAGLAAVLEAVVVGVFKDEIADGERAHLQRDVEGLRAGVGISDTDGDGE